MVRDSRRAGNAARKKVGRAHAPRGIVRREIEKSRLCYTAGHAFCETGKETFSRGRDGLHFPRVFRADGAPAQPFWYAHESSLSFCPNVKALDARLSAGLPRRCIRSPGADVPRQIIRRI